MRSLVHVRPNVSDSFKLWGLVFAYLPSDLSPITLETPRSPRLNKVKVSLAPFRSVFRRSSNVRGEARPGAGCLVFSVCSVTKTVGTDSFLVPTLKVNLADFLLPLLSVFPSTGV